MERLIGSIRRALYLHMTVANNLDHALKVAGVDKRERMELGRPNHRNRAWLKGNQNPVASRVALSTGEC